MSANQLPHFGHTVFYAYIIQLNGKPVGSVQKLNIRGSRESSRIGEVKYDKNGLAWKEILWGYESVTIDLSHIEFYTTSFLQAIGGATDYISLSTFNFAFDIEEIQYGHSASGVSPSAPTNILGTNNTVPTEDATILRTIRYERCVPTSYSKAIDRGTIHVAEDMTVECTSTKFVQ